MTRDFDMENKKQKSTAECLHDIAKACERIKRNLEVSKSVNRAVEGIVKSMEPFEGLKV